MSQFFKVFTDCKIVKGVNSALIYDLNNNNFYPLELSFADILTACDGKSLDYIQNNYPEGIELFLNEFVRNDIGFFTNTPLDFPDLSLTFMSPSKLSSAVMEINNLVEYDIFETIEQLKLTGCKLLLLKFSSKYEITNIEFQTILNLIEDSPLVSMELILPFTCYHAISLDSIINNSRISKILFYNSDSNGYSLKNHIDIYFTTDSYSDIAEVISPELFQTNITSFCEAKNYNVGLHKKVAIDGFGNIKNYLTHEKIFGNVKTGEIADIICSEEYLEKCKIKNDQIFQCMDCKYRYCCTSNSDIYISNGIYYKTEYCMYDTQRDLWG